MTLVSMFTPLGWGISKELARCLTYVGIGLITFGAIFGIWRFFKNPIEKTARIYSIISILSSMEERLWQLVQRQRYQDTDWLKYKETNDKINKLIGITVQEVTTVDEAKDKVEDLKNELATKHFIKGQPLSKRIEVARSISRLLDSDGFGLKKQRESDKVYLRLNKRVDKYYDDYKDIVDRDLDILIKSHKDVAEVGANASLVKHRVSYIMGLANILSGIPNLFSPSMQADMEGLEDDIKDKLRHIRIEISQHIKGIE